MRPLVAKLQRPAFGKSLSCPLQLSQQVLDRKIKAVLFQDHR